MPSQAVGQFVHGGETLRVKLVDTFRKNTSIDWTVKESVRAKLRTMVKRILRKHGYPCAASLSLQGTISG